MTPLIDGDILLHELGWSGEFTDKETKEKILMDFDHVADLLDKKIQTICLEVDATTGPIIFVTNSEWVQSIKHRLINPVPDYKKVFRYEIAKTKPYKGTRKNPKPFHFNNILVYLDSNYSLVISYGGYEADDLMTMYQYDDMMNGKRRTIICSRDKDLRICPGWHYSWECGEQRSIGPVETDEHGFLVITPKNKVIGYGMKFFYYQMLVGDSADNIPGLMGMGEKGAMKLLINCHTSYECYKAVRQAYIDTVGKEKAKEYFLEQANLLWMIRKEGVGYEIPNS